MGVEVYASAGEGDGLGGRAVVPGVPDVPADVEQWRGLVCAYGWPCDEALAVLWCESRGDPSAVSPDGQNIGLFQLNLIHGYYPGPEENVAKAYAIWLDYGGHWTAWACRP